MVIKMKIEDFAKKIIRRKSGPNPTGGNKDV
jgi:hypothetical protein